MKKFAWTVPGAERRGGKGNGIQWDRAMLFMILKWALVILCIVVLVLGSRGSAVSSTSFDEMKKAVLQDADLSVMAEADNQMIRRLYGLESADYDGILLYYPTTNMGAEEILLVKLADPSQGETVRAAIEKRVKSQLDSFEGYGAEQTALLQNSVQEIKGNYALLAVADNAAEIRKAFEKAY